MTPSINAETLYTAFFEALSSNSYLIQTDAPRYTILAVTAQHLKLTGLKKEDVIGKGVAEVLLSNPIDYSNAGKHDFLASLHHILTYKEAHYLPVQRYDIADAQAALLKNTGPLKAGRFLHQKVIWLISFLLPKTLPIR